VRKLLEERLIGCANILPQVRSMYWWEGAIQDDGEVVLLMETPAARVDAAVARLEELHPYDVPKIVAIDAATVNAPYLAWLQQVTAPA
jgi:periplasmic divalent cation tolerance protein